MIDITIAELIVSMLIGFSIGGVIALPIIYFVGKRFLKS